MRRRRFWGLPTLPEANGCPDCGGDMLMVNPMFYICPTCAPQDVDAFLGEGFLERRAAEQENAERAELARLKAKYEAT